MWREQALIPIPFPYNRGAACREVRRSEETANGQPGQAAQGTEEAEAAEEADAGDLKQALPPIRRWAPHDGARSRRPGRPPGSEGEGIACGADVGRTASCTSIGWLTRVSR
jgi:hypothetical protein